jgi:hypothetical protein
MENFEVALAALVDTYHNKINQQWAYKILVNQAEQIVKDESWVYDDTHPEPVAPTLTALTPNTAVLGSADVTMVCTGTGFTPESVINFNTVDEPIVFISDTEISTVVKPSIDWGAVAAPVFVKNGELVSETLDFTFTEVLAEDTKKRR